MTGDAIVLSGAGARFTRRVTLFAMAVLVELGRFATIAVLGGAEAFLVQTPSVVATPARRHVARSASGWARNAFAPLLVRSVSDRARRSTGAVERKQSGSTGDALVLGGSVASLARGMTRSAIVILRLVCVEGTGRVTLVFIHDQMMLATGTLVRPILATCAVRLARYARTVLRVLVISFRALLQAHS